MEANNLENKGFLIIIGGAEDKKGESVVLKSASQMLSDNDKLVVLTTATQDPQAVGTEYRNVFERLGVSNVEVLNINTREVANDNVFCEGIKDAKCLFISGGDQLRLTSILGGTIAYEMIKQVYYSGGIIMGTSAGASAMSSTMVVQGNDNQPARKCTLKMAPGLDLMEDTIIDQHFDQRGRFGRLLCGVSENPHVLGIGIDEDTAIKVFPDNHFEVIGSNAVTIINGKTIISSNVSELKPDEILAIAGVTVHALPAGYGFNLNNREVLRLS